MKKGKVILFWILFVLFVLLALGTLPHFSGVVALLTAAFMFPMAKWQELLQKHIKKTLKTILVIVLALTTLFTLPDVEPSESNNDASGGTDAIVATTTFDGLDVSSTTAASTTGATITTTITTTSRVVATTTVATVVTTRATTPTTKKITTTTKKPTTTTTKKITTTTAQKTKYVLNTESKKFHYITCKKLPTKNREDVTMSREEILSMGYSPCGICKP